MLSLAAHASSYVHVGISQGDPHSSSTSSSSSTHRRHVASDRDGGGRFGRVGAGCPLLHHITSAEPRPLRSCSWQAFNDNAGGNCSVCSTSRDGLLAPTSSTRDTWRCLRLSWLDSRTSLLRAVRIGTESSGGGSGGGGAAAAVVGTMGPCREGGGKAANPSTFSQRSLFGGQSRSFPPLSSPVNNVAGKLRSKMHSGSNGGCFSFSGSDRMERGALGAGSIDMCHDISDKELEYMMRAVQLAGASAGLTAPHPNFGCVIVQGPEIVGEGYLYAQGTVSAEVQAVSHAKERSYGATAYLNLEPGDCHGDFAAVVALRQARVARVVIGLRQPLSHQAGRAISALRECGITVDVLGEDHNWGPNAEEAWQACREVNMPLLYRAAYQMPFSILKYAMTLDGKIATTQGHAAWITSTTSRGRVFWLRARSNAIIVGGNTVRRDNPRLTTRQEGGHVPVRIVLSRSLSLPQDANLWDVSTAPTIVMTQKGVREDFQAFLVSKGVEVVDFDFLTPKAAMEHCYKRGFLQVLWECGGTLSAPAVTSGVIHKVWAFVAPKVIGGAGAPTPVGDLGFVEMTQAMNLQDVKFEQTGPDMLVSGYLKGLPDPRSKASVLMGSSMDVGDGNGSFVGTDPEPVVIGFYKPWDPYGALSNYSPHPILMTDERGQKILWRSVEHYYQAAKFCHSAEPVAAAAVQAIMSAGSPEEASWIGRRLERQRPDLLPPNWSAVKLEVMYSALQCKFTAHEMPRTMLLSTMGTVLVEMSPPDRFWGSGRDGQGNNHLGRLLMKLRSELTLDDTNHAASRDSDQRQAVA
ncbi:hypothetical protein CBR_g21226 [Chara braunii]|uniref:5-amino-6-(5-phosphoribosylamino)uracil reductase n=1 Tax=Chara braunii TaxID=69332 RepID=A0A388L0Y3_CHABU|nr:hypothetical protein CBR_g21226 [Chara braunii]|eukprot:GBG75984.1 hypothetical protein CBR_g21226 [Chara braunii]